MLRSMLLVAALAACRDEQVDNLRGIRDGICSCKTSKCADELLKKVPEANASSNRRTQKVAREMLECIARIHRDERPPEEE